nr:hypothetical protein [Tanacetum cinerariifolium]
NGSQKDISICSTIHESGAIRKLVADSVAAAREAQAATMANTDNTNRNTKQRETPATRKCSYKEFMSFQPFNFKGRKKSQGSNTGDSDNTRDGGKIVGGAIRAYGSGI